VLVILCPYLNADADVVWGDFSSFIKGDAEHMHVHINASKYFQILKKLYVYLSAMITTCTFTCV
jgi:hypothetical protein